MMAMRRGVLAAAVLLCAAAMQVKAAEVVTPTEPRLRIVFFTPSDVDPPEGVEERVRQMADYVQDFFSRWMKHWEYEPERELALDRDANGVPEILYVSGKDTEASGRYRKPDFQPEVIETACKQYGIQRQGQVWWILMYKGPQDNWGRGGGDALRGGAATARFYTEEGEIRVGEDLAGGFPREIMLKGAIHELGHALGLPHIGPRDSDKLGNCLMGPVNMVYARRKGPEDQRAYLSEAASAMLWKHPLFSEQANRETRRPRVGPIDGGAVWNKADGSFEVSGIVRSPIPVHSVVIAEESRHPRRDYWTQTFVGKVAADGSFSVRVPKLEERDGCLKIVFCCENGAVLGESMGRGFGSGFNVPYRYKDGSFQMVIEP